MSEGEQGFLGLTHNPFTSDDDAFFPGGDRKTHLDQLRHLGQWSRSLMIVTGPQGAGKTMLFRQLSMTLEARVKAARINGTLANSAKNLLASIAQGIGAAASADATSQTVSGTITAYVINQDRQGRMCLVMVDDAHRLSFGALEELLKLSKSCPVRVLLFGEPSIVGMVAKSAERQEVEWHETRLTGFSEEDIERYLTWRFEQAKYRDKLPFSRDQVSKLGKVSAGLPGEINRIAGDLVARLESGENKEQRRFPITHRLLIALLVVVVGLAYLVFSDSDARREKARKEVAEVTEIALPGTTPQQEERRSDGSGQEQVAQDQQPASDPVEAMQDQESDLDHLAETARDEAPAEEIEQAIEPEVEEAVPEPVQEVAETVRDPEPVPVADSRPSASEESANTGGVRTADWLLAQPSSYYTLQLVSVSSEARVHAFVDKQRRPQDFAWYALRRNESTLYVITYGLYETVDQARDAAKQMPAEVGNLEPWVRQLKYVQEAASL